MPTGLSVETLLFAFAAAFLFAVLIVFTKGWHGVITLDSTQGVQKVHTEPTPRIGGLAIFAGLAVAWPVFPGPMRELLWPVMLAALPAALFGLTEDLTGKVSVAARLLASLSSGVLLWVLSGYSITRVDVPFIDPLLKLWPLAVGVTAVVVGGMANAVNFIDGLNGLASMAVLCALAGFGGIASLSDDIVLVQACWALAAVVLGFACVNWPLGKIFLGDGGAYFLGFMLASIAILLAQRNTEVSAFAVLLVCVHPVTEVLFSIWRRVFRDHKPGHADSMHLHSLVNRRFVRQRMRGASKRVRNSISGLVVGGMNVAPVLVAVGVYDSKILALVAVLGFVLAYVAIYARLVRFYWCSPIGFLMGGRWRVV